MLISFRRAEPTESMRAHNRPTTRCATFGLRAPETTERTCELRTCVGLIWSRRAHVHLDRSRAQPFIIISSSTASLSLFLSNSYRSSRSAATLSSPARATRSAPDSGAAESHRPRAHLTNAARPHHFSAVCAAVFVVAAVGADIETLRGSGSGGAPSAAARARRIH